MMRLDGLHIIIMLHSWFSSIPGGGSQAHRSRFLELPKQTVGPGKGIWKKGNNCPLPFSSDWHTHITTHTHTHNLRLGQLEEMFWQFLSPWPMFPLWKHQALRASTVLSMRDTHRFCSTALNVRLVKWYVDCWHLRLQEHFSWPYNCLEGSWYSEWLQRAEWGEKLWLLVHNTRRKHQSLSIRNWNVNSQRNYTTRNQVLALCTQFDYKSTVFIGIGGF